ncbi:MAG: cupin domain-containing protein [Methanosarcinales archaeon]|nr:cupin domain-containing protein [Methanosarcinales archaeon]
MGIEIKKLQEAEGLMTREGLMKPLIFGEKIGVIHLEIPAGLEVSPHAHTTEGVLYCLSGELDVISKDEIVTISSESAILVSPDTEIGIKNLSNEPVKAILISSPPPVKSVEELKHLLEKHK